MTQSLHIPVLVDEVVLALNLAPGQTIVDGTFGRGGYSQAILAAAPVTVVGIDRDPTAIESGAALAAAHPGRLTLVEGKFGSMVELLAGLGIDQVDAVALDIGVSSPQIDDPERGFSFRADGPLDMRMGGDGPDAARVVNTLDEAELADIIWRYGEERLSRRVAKAIVAARAEMPIERTATLARIVRSCVPASRDGIDPATRTFQALRIYVNDELGELARGLAAAERLLKAGGRLAVVSFHSLEDRAIKNFLKARAGAEPTGSRHLPVAAAGRRPPSFRLVQRKPITAGEEELARNPRARSAKLRVAERTSAPAWPAPTGAEELAA
ncbi:ribosomal RNA small subunit methyltransferase H [Aliidongia dinghuensis]|uniref:Ribosomal RNA small subunit methyltransferase H n=1 Tax=Aliidongia dinghuensis TaxID=1867774 RepID=A0A8J2YTX4_9PROT|nr:16S rRNA (cytosine(1402)-N(4))-methyltransferase RsmH [Aliidongia dinghuensis]GGF17513.1 ribosomal RNA small subunit methyltransferase H [Aliidongia dinghuensis]